MKRFFVSCKCGAGLFLGLQFMVSYPLGAAATDTSTAPQLAWVIYVPDIFASTQAVQKELAMLQACGVAKTDLINAAAEPEFNIQAGLALQTSVLAKIAARESAKRHGRKACIVAKGTGGLVARSFVQDEKFRELAGTVVEKVLNLAVPQYGRQWADWAYAWRLPLPQVGMHSKAVRDLAPNSVFMQRLNGKLRERQKLIAKMAALLHSTESQKIFRKIKLQLESLDQLQAKTKAAGRTWAGKQACPENLRQEVVEITSGNINQIQEQLLAMGLVPESGYHPSVELAPGQKLDVAAADFVRIKSQAVIFGELNKLKQAQLQFKQNLENLVPWGSPENFTQKLSGPNQNAFASRSALGLWEDYEQTVECFRGRLSKLLPDYIMSKTCLDFGAKLCNVTTGIEDFLGTGGDRLGLSIPKVFEFCLRAPEQNIWSLAKQIIGSEDISFDFYQAKDGFMRTLANKISDLPKQGLRWVNDRWLECTAGSPDCLDNVAGRPECWLQKLGSGLWNIPMSQVLDGYVPKNLRPAKSVLEKITLAFEGEHPLTPEYATSVLDGLSAYLDKDARQHYQDLKSGYVQGKKYYQAGGKIYSAIQDLDPGRARAALRELGGHKDKVLTGEAYVIGGKSAVSNNQSGLEAAGSAERQE